MTFELFLLIVTGTFLFYSLDTFSLNHGRLKSNVENQTCMILNPLNYFTFFFISMGHMRFYFLFAQHFPSID